MGFPFKPVDFQMGNEALELGIPWYPLPLLSNHIEIDSLSAGGETIPSTFAICLGLSASSQDINLPILVGSKSFLERRVWFASLGQPLTHIETEKLLSPSNTSSVPPVDTVAKVPLDRSRDFPLPEATSVEKGLLFGSGTTDL